MNPYLLAAVGLILIYLEFYLPGAILGTLGGILLLWSYFIVISSGASCSEILFFIIGSLALVWLVIKFALWSIPRVKGGRGIYLAGDQEGYVSSTYDKNAIGKEAIVLTDLKPGGFILLEGKQMAALSLSGYIEKGKRVTVIAGDGDDLIVKLKELK